MLFFHACLLRGKHQGVYRAEFSHSHKKACTLFLLRKKKNLPFCPNLEDLNKIRIHSAFFAFFCPATKSYLSVPLQCVALGSLVPYKGEDLNWVNRTHQEWMAGERRSPTRHFAFSSVYKADTSLGGTAFPTDLFL